MGLNSGEVVVGTIGDDMRMDYTAQGHTVGLAQRVEQLAAPNSACVAQATAALVADYFELRDLGAFALKGVSEPVRVHELERSRRERTRIDVVLARSGTRLVGRRAELAASSRRSARRWPGMAGSSAWSASPASAKRASASSWSSQCRARGAVLAQAHCPAHAADVAWLPILELLRSLFDVHAGDRPDASRRKIRKILLQLGRSFDDAAVRVRPARGARPPAPRAVARGAAPRPLVSFLRHLIQAQSAAAPVVLFIDDVHCIDTDGDAVLGEIVDALGWTRTLLLVNFRPGYRSGMDERIVLSRAVARRAADGDVDALLRRLVGDDASTDDLRRLIRERTGGNPFFVEEVVQSLVDHGVLERPAAAAVAGRRRAAPPAAGAPDRRSDHPGDDPGVAGGATRPPGRHDNWCCRPPL